MKKIPIVIGVIVIAGAVGLMMKSSSKPSQEHADQPAKISATADANTPKTRLQTLLTKRQEKRKEALAAYERMTPEEKQRLVREQVDQRLGVNATPNEAQKQARIQAFKEKLAAMTPAQRQALLNQLRQELRQRSAARDANATAPEPAPTKPATGQ